MKNYIKNHLEQHRIQSFFKKILVTILFLIPFTQNNIFAQSFTLSVFSENSERFWVVINGEKKNDKASSSVKVIDLTGSYWKMKIMFENESLPEITQNVYRPFDASATTYQIKKNRKGNYVLRMYSASDFNIGNNNTRTNNSRNNNFPNNNGNGNNNRNSNNGNGSNNGNNNGVNININLGNNQMGNNQGGINPNGNNGNWNNNGNGNNNLNEDDENLNRNNNGNTGWGSTNNGNNNNGNTGNWGNNNNGNTGNWGNNNGKCSMPMSSQDFDLAFQNVERQNFEETKMTVAKQFTSRNCMTVQQIRKIISIFDFENHKLQYAKYAYDFCFDKQNYYLLNDAFDFSTSITDLNNFLESKK